MFVALGVIATVAALTVATFTEQLSPWQLKCCTFASAFAFGLLSVSSFLYLAWSVGRYNSLLSRVVAADVLALACLLAGAAVYAYTQREG